MLLTVAPEFEGMAGRRLESVRGEGKTTLFHGAAFAVSHLSFLGVGGILIKE